MERINLKLFALGALAWPASFAVAPNTRNGITCLSTATGSRQWCLR